MILEQEGEWMLDDKRFVILNQDKVPTHSLSEHHAYDDVKDMDNLAILIDPPYVVFDVDDALSYMVLKNIIEVENVRCRIMKTDRGGHFWFKSIEPFKNYVNVNTAITVSVDVRSHGKKSLCKVKSAGKWRKWENWDDEVDDVPYWLRPIHHDYCFVHSKEGDGRNSQLFSYIITLTNAGITKDQTKHIYELINDHLFSDKLGKDELNTILRDEAFDKIKPAFFKGRKFLHDIFSKYFRNDNHVFVKYGRLYMYHDGYYSDYVVNIEKRMIQYIPELAKQQRKEVLEYLKLIATQPANTSQYHMVCRNGIIDIREPELQPFTSDIFISNKINAVYNEKAYDITVDKTLDKICQGDKKLRMLLEELVGYALIPTTKFQKAFILYGDGANGKSTFLDMIIALLGEQNVSSLSLKELNHNFKLTEITSKMANIGDDISDEHLTDSSIFKKLVTGEELTVDKKNEAPYKIRNYAKMIFSANNIPTTQDKSSGMMRRLVIIPFNATFKKSDPDYDPFIVDKLTSENALSYLLNLGLAGIRRVFENNGFTESEKVNEIIEEYHKENNNVLQFLERHNLEGQTSTDAYNDYKFWCTDTGVMFYKIRKFNAEVRNNTDLDLKVETVGGRSVQVWQTL